MRDPERIERITAKLAELWKRAPDLRLGQLVSNTMGAGPQDVFYLEDDTLEASLDEWLASTTVPDTDPPVTAAQLRAAYQELVPGENPNINFDHLAKLINESRTS